MLPGQPDRRAEQGFGAPDPHVGFGAFKRIAAEQRRFRVKFIEIAADADGFGDHPAIIEFEKRHLAARVFRQHLRRFMLALEQRQRRFGDRQPLDAQERRNPPRVGRRIGCGP